MLRLLKEKKNLNSGSFLYQFIHEAGEEKFFEHVAQVSNLIKLTNNKKEFDRLFKISFEDVIKDDLFPEHQILKNDRINKAINRSKNQK